MARLSRQGMPEKTLASSSGNGLSSKVFSVESEQLAH